MVEIRLFNTIVLLIMSAVIVLNLSLALNFFAASGQAIAARFTTEGIFQFAAIELAIVLVVYILHKHQFNS